jgi:hypothetical protein
MSASMEDRLADAIGGTERWVRPLQVAYTAVSMLSSLGRSDVNVAFAIFGLLFMPMDKNRTYRLHYSVLLVMTMALDIAWLILLGGVTSQVAREHPSFSTGLVTLAFAMTIFNLPLKVFTIWTLTYAGPDTTTQTVTEATAEAGSPRSTSGSSSGTLPLRAPAGWSESEGLGLDDLRDGSDDEGIHVAPV